MDKKIERKSLIRDISPSSVEVAKQGMLTITKGLTLKLADYEFARADVSIQMPFVIKDKEKIYFQTSEWVEKRLLEEIDRLQVAYETK